MAKKKHYSHWRACSSCGHYEPEPLRDKYTVPKQIVCPRCDKRTFNLKTYAEISYLEWKGEIGAGRMLREVVKEQT